MSKSSLYGIQVNIIMPTKCKNCMSLYVFEEEKTAIMMYNYLYEELNILINGLKCKEFDIEFYISQLDNCLKLLDNRSLFIENIDNESILSEDGLLYLIKNNNTYIIVNSDYLLLSEGNGLNL